ncbi:mediator of RNA polymerase II transcription subunit 12-like isoform X2 [Danaus plexippus]|uniref:mediator of RNA polymerase II transcription subunit 12-like isoform X2 n=1 Tax=Danaus plexippus TaxID=13037 RepID=UPI002AB0C1DE|nr:mediator of RNA polymerase II transcription subunit 12-like isoform X2 [Danaus plexippus]
MRLLVLAASLWAFALAKPEMYKETEDFQYSRSSTDEGSKSGFYGAQRGNMGGNYEKAHNMDSLAQHHMSTLVRQVDGELGEGANTRTGSVYTAGKSRGIFGSGNYDLTNLKGRNFGESGIYGDSLSQSMYQNGYHGAYGSSNARYGSEQAHSSSSKQSGYTASNVASQYSAIDASDVESANKYHGVSSYDYGNRGASDLRYHSLVNSQARNEYDQSNANLYSAYDLNNQNRLIATPVKVYVRPGGRVAVPISAQTYALHSASLQDKNVAVTSSNSASDVLSNTETDLAYKPTSSAKHYESAYSYRKKWEKHDTQPLAVIPTENPFPANSELYEDRLDQTGQQYQSGLDSSRSHLSNVNSGYSSNRNYETEASSQAQLNKASRAYSSGFSSNTKSASAHQARYQTQALNKDASVISNAHSVDGHSLGESTSNLNSLVEDISSKPKSYHSSYSYHKAWERRGDPYVIIPAGDAGAQTSQRLTAASKNLDQYSSNQYDQKSYSDACDIICHQRKKRSYNMKQFEQDADDSQAYLGQQLENGWDLGQQAENKFEHLEDLGQGQEAQNTWDNLENLGQQEQNKWNDLQPLGQEVQNKWEKLEDLGQQTQQNWDSLTDLGQKTQDDFGQQTENEKAKLEDFGQQTQSEKLEDMGQQAQNQWGKLEELGQQTQSEWKDLGQQTQNQWGKLEELGQQTQNQWKDFGQQVHSQWEDMGQQTQKQWKDFGEQTQKQWKDYDQKNKNQWDKLEALGHQTENRGFLEDNFKNETGDSSTSQHDKTPSIVSKETEIKPKANDHKFLWDEISQMFDEPSKTETIATNDNGKENEQSSLVKPSNEKQKPVSSETSLNTFDQDKHETPTNPFGLGYHSTSLDNKQTENIIEANQRLLDALKGISNTQNQGFDVGKQNKEPWSDLGQQTQNVWSNLGQQTQNVWSDLGQQTEQKWSDLGQQTQHEFSDLGQQTQNEWSDLGQQTAHQWSDLGQQTQHEFSDLGQQTQNVWSNLGQLTQNELSDLGHQTAQKWSDLSQQTQDEFSNLGQQTQHEWSDLGQQTQYDWNNLGQQTQHEFSSFGQENHNKLNYFNQQNLNDWSTLNHQYHHQWTGSGQQIHKQWSYLDNIGSQTPFNVHQQQNIGGDKSTIEESTKAAVTKKTMEQYDHEQDKQKTEHNVISEDTINIHSVESLQQNESTTKITQVQDKLTSTTQKPIITTSKKDIGRGDIGADEDFSNVETFDMVSLSSSTRKPEKSEDKSPDSQKFDVVPIYPEETEKESLHQESQSSLTSKSLEDQFTEQQQSAATSFEDQFTDQQQSEFEQQNVDLQQNLQNWDTGIHDTQQIYKANDAPLSYSYPHQEHGRHLPDEPQEEVIQQQNLDQFVEKENKHDSENLKATSEKTIQVETPTEPTTEKPGFWSSVLNKTKKAKDTVSSWFRG